MSRESGRRGRGTCGDPGASPSHQCEDAACAPKGGRGQLARDHALRLEGGSPA